MSRNGSGTYSLPSNSWNPAVNGTPATAADWQTLINDVAAALTQSLSKDGQTPLTGNLAAGGNKVTGLAAATASGDAVRFEQVGALALTQGVAASGANADITSLTALSAGGLPNGSVTPSDLSQPLTLGTSVAVSGTSVSFTSIPSWVRRITVMFNGVSTNSTNNIQVQLGSGSVETSGYIGGVGMIRAGGTSTNYANSTGFIAAGEVLAVAAHSGLITITLLGSNTWVASGVISDSTPNRTTCAGGAKALAGVLDQIRIIASATGAPSDTFDAGSVNILYEG